MVIMEKGRKCKTKEVMVVPIAATMITRTKIMVSPIGKTRGQGKAGKVAAAINHNSGVMMIGIEEMKGMAMVNRIGREEIWKATIMREETEILGTDMAAVVMMKDIAILVIVKVAVPAAIQMGTMKTETGGKEITATTGPKEIVIGGIVQKMK